MVSGAKSSLTLLWFITCFRLRVAMAEIAVDDSCGIHHLVVADVMYCR